MAQTWGSTPLGQIFTPTKPWSLTLDGDQFTLSAAGNVLAGEVVQLDGKLTVKRGAIWTTVVVDAGNGPPLRLDGIANDDARKMCLALTAAIAVATLLREFPPLLEQVVSWAVQTKQACRQELDRRGWLSHEFKAAVVASRPTGLERVLAIPEGEQHLTRQDANIKDAVAAWRRPFFDVADGINKRHLVKELVASHPFFDKVEKSPLTEEQAEAVICFDSRVLLVASAGSGKTSTMVAKAGYALQKGYFAADHMLLLAFNNDAAAELRARIKARLEPLGLPADQIVAKTFHAFGLDVIGAATGKKPTLAPWIEAGRDLEALIEMVDELKDSDPMFRVTWDLFRLVFSQDLPKFGEEEANPDTSDRESGRTGFLTLKGDVVKSRGEVLIANWLFYHGVAYRYEAPYKVDTADARHRQYHPDFYLPGPDVYLEHWAVDANGEPPADFAGYKEGMAWKRGLHAAHGTTLLETTMADLWSGKAFTYLERELRKLGVELDPNPDREVPGRKPIENPRMARTMRSFITHAKSNRLTVDALRRRLGESKAGQSRYRHEMFLNLLDKLWARWEQRLKAEGCIDFEDMLNQAADCIEQDRWASPYELVMVDEFQDASQARARLVAGLVGKPGRHLFAVGDDWQSINRFAGADLGVMTDFEARFGKAVTLRLETTFRCPQALCDITSGFVRKNPRQIAKNVRSPRNDVELPVRIVRVAAENRTRSAVAARVADIASAHRQGDRPAKVYILGRYRRDAIHVPQDVDAERVQVEFITVHSSKGLEADHVIVPGLTSDRLGFPSQVVDDPVLHLAMPGGDNFEFAEERRLFYVALTRARQTVTLLTVARKESAFITELVRDFNLMVVNADGSESSSEVCAMCGTGFMVPRNGPYGPFYGCTGYPLCRHKRQVDRNSQIGRQVPW